MNCQQAQPLIDPYADGELEAAAILELEQHLQTCSACGVAYRNLQGLRKSLKQDALYFTAPDDLRKRIKAELPSPGRSIPQPGPWNWNRLTTAMSCAAAACLALLLTVTMTRRPLEQPLVREIVSSHIRSLMANHVMDVVSTDQHTVKPWFNGKLDFSPPVRDMAAQGFPLIGGRLDYLGGRGVAVLVYQRHKHIINLFVWPTSNTDTSPAVVASRQGYHLVHWSEAGMAFWAVSDVNEKELMELSQYYAASPL